MAPNKTFEFYTGITNVVRTYLRYKESTFITPSFGIVL